MEDLIVGALGGLIATVLYFAYQYRKSQSGDPGKQVLLSRQCPDCQTPTPVFRLPTSKRQLLHGGWTCKKCGCEMDRFGKKIEDVQ